MDVAKVREMSDEQLREQLTAAGETIFRVRFQKSMGNLEGLKGLGESKLAIARIKTVQREREIAAARAAAPSSKGQAPARSERTARKQAKGAQ